MDNIAGDSRYEISYRSTWGADGGPLGHLVIRRLDDHAIMAEIPAATEDEARKLIARAEDEVRGPASAFERTWGITGPEEVPAPAPHLSPASPWTDRGLVESEEVSAPDPRVHVLPDPSDVFAADQPWLARVLHPLLSIELGAIDPAWTGRVHLLSPVEPGEGLLGQETDAHHDEHAGENWITFRLGDDDRYTFLGHPRFFRIEDAEASGEALSQELRQLYAEAESDIAGARTRWERLGALVWGTEEDPSVQREGWGADLPLVDALGGEPGYGNWASFPPPPSVRLDESDTVSPVLRLSDGRPFTFVAATAGYPWRRQGADAILLFFEPRTRTVALTFDWT
ncbi:hypothetical protein ACFWHT_11435 [Microbacterium sp. NPDC058342]|uniref:hypothetical protein n=1 Tax=Microbacterium sp. NPDC058342 TaxID=3346454 RepID=UPI00365F0253